MNRKRLFVASSLVTAIAVSGAALALSVTSAGPPRTAGAVGRAVPQDKVSVAGPFGSLALSPFRSYVKRVTFQSNELGQYQRIAARLPAGRYLVRVLAADASSASAADCMGVAFPLVPSVDGPLRFTGYVSVADSQDPATVLCYEMATAAHSTATYQLAYVPLAPLPPPR